jgi:hypothetical protein
MKILLSYKKTIISQGSITLITRNWSRVYTILTVIFLIIRPSKIIDSGLDKRNLSIGLLVYLEKQPR